MSNKTLQNYIDKYKIKFDGVCHLGCYNGEEVGIYINNGAKYVLWAEANPQKWSGLKNGLCKLPNQYLCCNAVTNKDGEFIAFKVYNRAEASSIYNPGDDLDKWYPEHRVKCEFQVPTITVDTMFKEHNLDINHCNFLNMDIQGAEILALQGATKLLNSPNLKYIYTEIVWANFYETGSALKKDIEPILDSYGFKLVEIAKDIHKAEFQETQDKIDRGEWPEVAQADCLYLRT